MNFKMLSEGQINKHYGEKYEFCPRCNADLTYQRGFNRKLANWICRGCGEMLINPDLEDDSDIVWICDGCGATLNIQNGFSGAEGEWICTECGFINQISSEEVYASEEEYIEKMKNPLNGLSDEDLKRLSVWSDIDFLSGQDNMFTVRNRNTGESCVKKILTMYDADIYRFLMQNPVSGMPKIHEIYEARNHLIVIEEYIQGMTIEDILERECLKPRIAIDIAIKVCKIAKSLHELETPIIHRDIKPSNIMVTNEGEVVLLDINAAKWYKPEDIEDTRLIGTHYYAAPEQFGFGYSGSSVKTDIYGIGILLNKMITGKIPKEMKAEAPVWNVIEKCISYDIESRYADEELIFALEKLQETYKNGQVQHSIGIPTKYPDLDYILRGLHTGDTYVIASRPAMGKTALALNIVENLSFIKEKKIAYFSLGQPKNQVASRLTAIRACVDYQKIKKGNLTENERERLRDCEENLANDNIFINDNSALNLSDVEDFLNEPELAGIKLVFIDDYQLLLRNLDNQEKLNVAKTLKRIAQEKDVAIVVLSRLSRDIDDRECKLPLLIDLPDDNLRRCFDNIIFIYREEYYERNTERKNIADLIIAKNKSGNTGTVSLAWIPEIQKFCNVENGYDEN